MPHTMKRLFVYCLAGVFCALLMSSCLGESKSSPHLQVASLMTRTSLAGVTDTIAPSDSLQVGDTARLGIYLYGFANYLNSFTVNYDEDMLVSLGWNEADSAYLSPAADPEKGMLYFRPEAVYSCVTIMTFVPRTSGTHRLDMYLASSAGSPYSPMQYYYDVKVK